MPRFNGWGFFTKNAIKEEVFNMPHRNKTLAERQLRDIEQFTDNSGGTASDTLVALTNIGSLTDNTNGTADTTLADTSTAVTGVDGTGSNAASKADVDTRLTAIDANFADLAAQHAIQLAFNTAVKNAIASLSSKVNGIIERTAKDV